MINLRDWSINDWLDWAAKNNRYLLIAGNFNIDKKHIEISGFTLFKRYIKVEGNLDEIDIDDNANTITIQKDDYTIECKNVFAYFKGIGYIYVCYETNIPTTTASFEITIGDDE